MLTGNNNKFHQIGVYGLINSTIANRRYSREIQVNKTCQIVNETVKLQFANLCFLFANLQFVAKLQFANNYDKKKINI